MAKEYLIAGNWKMNLTTHEASLLVHRLNKLIKVHRDVEVVLAPSMLNVQPLSLQIDRRKFRLAAQNAYHKDAGAFTGEVSFSMLHNLVHYVIVGHSERRLYFNETLEIVRDKVSAAVRNEISPILCIGETQTERRAGETKQSCNCI
jgi:triosephosphate isomerase